MKIEIKKSTKLIEYKEAIDFLEKRLAQINQKRKCALRKNIILVVAICILITKKEFK